MFDADPALRAACNAQLERDRGLTLEQQIELDEKQELQKYFATLQARAALAGHQLTRIATGHYMLSKGVHSLHVADLEKVEEALGRMTSRTA